MNGYKTVTRRTQRTTEFWEAIGLIGWLFVKVKFFNHGLLGAALPQPKGNWIGTQRTQSALRATQRFERVAGYLHGFHDNDGLFV